MSAFVDATLLHFVQDAFVTDLLTNRLGITAIFNAMFKAVDVDVQSIEMGQFTERSFKLPVFETVRSTGTDERIVPDVQRVRTQRTLARYGRLDWIDVAFDAVFVAKVQTQVAPLRSVTIETLEHRLGAFNSIEQLRARLETDYPPSMVDDIFARLRISTIEDFARQIHLFVELVGDAIPPFDPDDPAVLRSYDVQFRVKVVDGFDVAGALQAAKLCRSILEGESIPEALDGVERTVPHAFIVLFADASVTDASIPGHTAAQAKTAVGDLFIAEHMFAQFIN